MADILPTIWFVAIGLLWFGFVFLDGFDLGVGIRMLLGTKDERKRRTMLNSIGPFWDGNEVWLIMAVGAMFAAFPFWYASLLSGSYLLCLVIIVGLILRAVGIEYRSKGHSDAWRTWATRAISIGSLVAAGGIGGLLGLMSLGLPIDANGDSYNALGWITPGFLLGALAVIGFSLVHGAAFTALKTTGDVNEESHRFIRRWSVLLLVPFITWVGVVVAEHSSSLTIPMLIPLVFLIGIVWMSNYKKRDGLAFSFLGIFLLCSLASIYVSLYPVVLPSTLSEAYNLTVGSASSSPYTLSIMTIVALIGLPIVIIYQLWTYWVFRKRLSDKAIPLMKLLEKKPSDEDTK